MDFLMMDELLTDEEKTIRETARKFVHDKFLPKVEEYFEEGTFPVDLIPELGEMGFFGANLKGYGCPGISEKAYGLLMRELEYGDSGLRSCVSVQGALCMYAIYAFGSEEQKQKWLPEMAKGKAIGCFGLTEADYGSNPGGMLTNAVKKDGGYLINGSKMWITNGNLAALAIVWAKTEDGNVRGFIVETDREGFKANVIHRKWSLRASITSELVFEDVWIPEENLMPESMGLKSPLMCLNQARFGIAWGALGAAEACFDEVKRYTDERIIFDRSLSAYQIPQQKMVKMLTEITKGRLLVERMTDMKIDKTLKHFHVSMAKMNNCEIALDIARSARDLLGGNGITTEYCIGRHMCNLETVKTYEGTHDIHTLILGRHITGHDSITR